MSDDLFAVTMSGGFAQLREAIKATPDLDFGCHPHLDPIGGDRYSLRAFVPSTRLPALQTLSRETNLDLTVGRNASEDGRERQKEIAHTLPSGAKRLAGRGAKVTHPDAAPITNYLDVDLVEQSIQAIAAAHPTLCQLVTLPNKSIQGRTVQLLRIGDRNSKKIKGVLFTGCAHAREWGGAEICLNLASDLLDSAASGNAVTYGKVVYSPQQVIQILDTVDLFILPCINPDGRNFSMTSMPLWRRNMNNPPVDLNRNYDFLWNFPALFDPTVANGTNPATLVPPASTDPTNDLYHGKSAVSEPECKNVVWVLDTFPQIGWFIDIHSYTGDVLFSWGDAPDQSTNPAMNFANAKYDGHRGVVDPNVYAEYISPQDQLATQAAATATVSAIKAVRSQNYLSRQDFFLSVGQQTNTKTYPTSGAVDDYAFSRAHSGKPRVYSFTLEFGTTLDFHPPFPEMGAIIDDIDAGLMAFCLFNFDPCAALQQTYDDLQNQLDVDQDAFNAHEFPSHGHPPTLHGSKPL